MRTLLKITQATAVVAVLALPAFCVEPVRLQQALQAAAAKAQTDDAGVAVAEGRVRLLRNLDKLSIDLRPQAGVFSFSDPNLVATSVGAGVVFSHRAAAGPAAAETANLDVLAAELARNRARIRTETETALRFFELLGKQQIAERSCGSLQQLQQRFAEVSKLIQNAKLTAVDRVRFEQQTLDREMDCLQAESVRKVAAFQLAAAMGVSDDEGSTRVAEELGMPVLGVDRPVPPLERLVEVALDSRPEPKLIRERILSLRPKADVQSKLRPDIFAVSYSHLQQNSGRYAGSTGSGYLLGGNTVRAESTWNLPLRSPGHEASNDLTDIRLKRLERETAALREEIRGELALTHMNALSNVAKVPLARRKLELSNRGQLLTMTRFQNGLGGSTSVFDAEQDALRAQGEYTQAMCDLKASTFVMLTIAGVSGKTGADLDRLLGAPSPAATSRKLQTRAGSVEKLP